MRISDWSSDVCSSDLAATIRSCQRPTSARCCARSCAASEQTASGTNGKAPARRGSLQLLMARRTEMARIGVASEGRSQAATAQQAERMSVRAYCEQAGLRDAKRSEEHTSELQSLMRISYAVFCLKKKKKKQEKVKKTT